MSVQKVFDFKKKSLDFVTKDGIRFNFNLREHITMLSGDSGVGKSYFVDVLEEKVSNFHNSVISSYDFTSIKIIRESFEVNMLNLFSQALIIIDKADIILTEAHREFIHNDENNLYLIIGRNADFLDLTPDCFAVLKQEGQEVFLEYDKGV